MMRMMKSLSRLLAWVLVVQILAPAPRVMAAITEVPLTIAVGAPRVNPLTRSVDLPVTVTNNLGFAVPGPIALASYVDPDPPVQPAPGLFQPYLIGKYGPIYPNGSIAPFPSYVDLPTGLAPGQSVQQVLRFFNRDDVVANWRNLKTFTYPPNPGGFPPYATSFPTTGVPIDIASGQQIVQPTGFLPCCTNAWRTVAWRLQTFQYDFEATNFNGGTLTYQIVPVPNLPPALAGASFASSANIDSAGVVRWFPPAVGLYAFRIQVSDGIAAPGGQDVIVDVREPSSVAATDPIACANGALTLDAQTQLVPAPYDILKPNDPITIGRAYARVAEGRGVSCNPATSSFMGLGQNAVTCRTIDGLFPTDQCSFSIAISKPAPPPAPRPPDLEIKVTGAERFQNCTTTSGYELSCQRYLAPTTTDVGAFGISVLNAGDQPASNVLVKLRLPVTIGGNVIDDEDWVLFPGAAGTCTLFMTTQEIGYQNVPQFECVFGNGVLQPGQRIDLTFATAKGNAEDLFARVQVSTSSAEVDLADNEAFLTTLKDAGAFVVATPQQEQQACQLREDYMRGAFVGLAETFRCDLQDNPWARWLTFAVLTATSLLTGGANFLLASQTVVGANFRSFVFGIGEAVALVR
ncbi:hypothetical protein K2X89_06755 [Myxococcota bacterium]|nr:hypothetical protein [Myxococcota bacterium]